MITKLTIRRFRTRRPDPVQAPPVPVPPRPQTQARPQVHQIPDNAFMPDAADDGFGTAPFETARGDGTVDAKGNQAPNASKIPTPGSPEAAPMEIDAIRREGLTGRQLRMARRLAQKHNLPATSDFDAIRLLRARGIDPFNANAVLELVSQSDSATRNEDESRALTVTPGGKGNAKLPQTMPSVQLPSPEQRAEQAHLAEIMKIQRDIVRRRRRRSALMMARLFIFVLLPTILAGFYYYTIATPLYAVKTAFIVQQAQPAATGVTSGLLQGTQFATSLDSIAVQDFLQSQAAMNRLEKDKGYRSHFSQPDIDTIQRLEPDKSESGVYRLYKRLVRVSYDPSDGNIQMEVLATNPDMAIEFSQALISYAEQQIDQMRQRLRDDQMKGAEESHEDADRKLQEANANVLELQKKYKVLSSEVEVGLLTAQITQLDTQLTQEKLSLAQMEANPSPNPARTDPVKRRIATLQSQIDAIHSKLTQDGTGKLSLAEVQGELLEAQADVQTRQLMFAQSLQALEVARVEANRQSRYLTVSSPPVRPDEPVYPRAFENTLVVMLIFLGIYLMITMTVAILREQLSA